MALAFGILGLTCLPLVGPAGALYMGYRSKREAEASDGQMDDDLGKVGRILGCVGLVPVVFILAQFVIFRPSADLRTLAPTYCEAASLLERRYEEYYDAEAALRGGGTDDDVNGGFDTAARRVRDQLHIVAGVAPSDVRETWELLAQKRDGDVVPDGAVRSAFDDADTRCGTTLVQRFA